MKKEIILKNGLKADIRPLDDAELVKAADLHHAVYEALPEEQKAFVLPKTLADFEEIVREGGIVLGAMIDGKLVGIAAMRMPNEDAPETGLAYAPADIPLGKLAILQGTVVDPAFQGFALQQEMIEARVEIAHALGRDYAMSEVEKGNYASLKSLMKRGFHVESAVIDPRDEAAVFALGLSLKARFNSADAEGRAVFEKQKKCKLPLTQFNKVGKVLSKGGRGVALEQAEDGLQLIIRF
jgi:GNAT superfamily N-acetyltransferase